MNLERRARGEKEIWPWYEEPKWMEAWRKGNKKRGRRDVKSIVEDFVEESKRNRDS